MRRRTAGDLILAILVLSVYENVCMAATVTVDPTGGGDYLTLSTALGDYLIWGDGSADRVELTDAVHHIDAPISIPAPLGDGSLQIGAASGTVPFVAPIAPNPPSLLFEIHRAGFFTFDGLVLIGPNQTNGVSIRVFAIDADNDAEIVDVTISDCVLTANDGSDQPILDYTLPRPSTGQLGQAVTIGDRPNRGDARVSIQHSVIAYCGNDDAPIFIRGVSQSPLSQRRISLNHVLVANNQGSAIRIQGQEDRTSLEIRESCLVGNGNRGLLILSEDGENSPEINVVKSIIDSTGGSVPVGASGFAGALSLEGVTLSRPGADLIEMEDVTGQDSYVLRDIICGPDHDSCFRYRPDGTINPATLVVESIAGRERIVRDNQTDEIKAIFAGLYGGAGPLTDNPIFTTTAFANDIFALISEWERTANSFFDVGNHLVFEDKASDGGFLSGGADPGEIIDIVPPEGSRLAFEPFDAAPAWNGDNNLSTSPPCDSKSQDFGYSPLTFFAGGILGIGEIGGWVERSLTRAYYAQPIAPKTLDDSFSASGKFAVTSSGGGSGALFGWFNSEDTSGWRNPNALVFRLDGENGFYRVYSEYGTQNWHSGSVDIDRSTDPMHDADGTVHEWELIYDPNDAEGNGAIHFTLDGEPSVVELAAKHRADGAVFDRFGLFNQQTSGSTRLRVFIDDLVVDGVPEDFSQDPGWIEEGSRDSFTDCEVRPRHNFGFRNTNKAGGSAPGEMGGLMWRTESNQPETTAYFADTDIGTLTLEDDLFAGGKISFQRGGSDAGMLVGWFNTDTFRVDGDTGFPSDFIGVFIEGPSRDGYYFRPGYSTSAPDVEEHVSPGPRFIPDRASHDWAIRYDPAANGGNGAVATDISGKKIQLNLSEEHRSLGAHFNAFGLVTIRTGGHFVDLFYDDIQYVVHPSSRSPEAATDPSPADGEIDVGLEADLSWTAGIGASTHEAYFGTTTAPPLVSTQTQTSYDPGTLEPGTTYYWRIHEVNDAGTTVGVLWSFTTLAPPSPASNPSPSNGAVNVGLDEDLTWTAGLGAETHRVFFGTTDPPPFIAEQTETVYDPGQLLEGVTYHWRIDESNAAGTTQGTGWSFSTVPPPLPIDDNDPAVEYISGWHRRSDSTASNGGYHRRMGSQNSGNGSAPTARLVFTGHKITYFYGTSDKGGTADVFIDGVQQATIDFQGAGPGGPGDNPTFDQSVTFDNLGEGQHEILIQHLSGAVYVDGFEVFSNSPEGGADESAAQYASETESNHSELGSPSDPVVTQSVEVGPNHEHLSVVVEGMDHSVLVELLDPAGSLLASGQALLPGGAISGIDADLSSPGTYTLVITDVLGPPTQVLVSIAHTILK